MAGGKSGLKPLPARFHTCIFVPSFFSCLHRASAASVPLTSVPRSSVHGHLRRPHPMRAFALTPSPQSACRIALRSPARRLHCRRVPPVAVPAAASRQLVPAAFSEAAQLPAAPSCNSKLTAWEVYTLLFLPSVKAGAYASATCFALDLPLDASVIEALVAAAFLVYGVDRGILDAVSERTRVSTGIHSWQHHGDCEGTLPSLSCASSTSHAQHHDETQPFVPLPLQRNEGYTTKRGRFMNRHQVAVRASLAAATVGMVAAAAQLPTAFSGGLLPILAISLAYAVPMPFLGGYSMRTAPGGKTVVACSMWALACAWLPAVACGQGAELDGAQLAAMLLHTFVCSATVRGTSHHGLMAWCVETYPLPLSPALPLLSPFPPSRPSCRRAF